MSARRRLSVLLTSHLLNVLSEEQGALVPDRRGSRSYSKNWLGNSTEPWPSRSSVTLCRAYWPP